MSHALISITLGAGVIIALAACIQPLARLLVDLLTD